VVARLVLARFARRLPPDVASELLGPSRLRATRGAAASAAPPPQSAMPPRQPIRPGADRVIDGEIQP
jgi:hypothetical protein